MLRWDIVILLLVLLSSSHILNTQYLPTNPLFHNFRQKSFRGRTIRWEYKSWAIKKHLAKKSKWCGATFVAAFTMLLCWDSAVTLPTETLVANYLYALLIFQNNNYIYALLICHNNNNAWHPEPKSTLIIFREESKSATTKKLNTNLTRPEKSGNLYICSLSSLSVSPLNFCSFFYECFFNTFSRRSNISTATMFWRCKEQKTKMTNVGAKNVQKNCSCDSANTCLQLSSRFDGFANLCQASQLPCLSLCHCNSWVTQFGRIYSVGKPKE